MARNEVKHGFKGIMKVDGAISCCAASSVCHFTYLTAACWRSSASPALSDDSLSDYPRSLLARLSVQEIVSPGVIFSSFLPDFVSSHLSFMTLSSFRFVWTFDIRYDMQIILSPLPFHVSFSPHFVFGFAISIVSGFLSEGRTWSPLFHSNFLLVSVCKAFQGGSNVQLKTLSRKVKTGAESLQTWNPGPLGPGSHPPMALKCPFISETSMSSRKEGTTLTNPNIKTTCSSALQFERKLGIDTSYAHILNFTLSTF